MENRIVYIDYLKVIGLLCIILAHVCTNDLILQLRNFDVPLMVLVSGFLSVESYKRSLNKDSSLMNYYWKRIKRLLFPTWIFLLFFFIFMNIFFLDGSYGYGLDKIIRSFLLLDGIGYVWIIRVYLICALLTPLFFYFNSKIKSNSLKFIILVGLYLIYELSVFYHLNESGIILGFFISYAIPYGVIYALGMFSKRTSSKRDLYLAAGFLLIFIFSAIILFLQFNGFQLTQGMKYPPRIYYISYALFVSFLLLAIFKKANLKENGLLMFISRSSLWIYLWHILFLKTIPRVFTDLHWSLCYIIIVFLAVVMAYLQNHILDLLEEKGIKNSFLKVFRG